MSSYWYTKSGGSESDGDRISPHDTLHVKKNSLSDLYGHMTSSYLEDGMTNGKNTPLDSIEAILSYYDKMGPTYDYPYGNVLSLNVSGASQLFMPWPRSLSLSPIAEPLYYRAITDNTSYMDGIHWTPWRRIAYYDEIEAVVIAVLKSKGLIT